jgi:glycine reductase
MVEDLNQMVNLGLKLMSGENVGRPERDGYFPRGIVKNEYVEKTAAERAVDMLLMKIQNEPFQTELEVKAFPAVYPPRPLKELRSCEIALISDGGLAPKGNPDGFKGRGNTAWAAYDLDNFFQDDYSSQNYEIIHTGYFPIYVLENPNRLVPVDVMRDLEKERVIGKLHSTFYSTSGNGALEARCIEMGKEVLGQLKNNGVDGAMLTST